MNHANISVCVFQQNTMLIFKDIGESLWVPLLRCKTGYLKLCDSTGTDTCF